VNGSTTDRLRSAAEAADALLHDACVAVQDRHMLVRDAELIRKHLRERRLVALSVRRCAGRGADTAVTFDGDLRMLPATRRQRRRRTETADLHVHREPDADEAAFL